MSPKKCSQPMAAGRCPKDAVRDVVPDGIGLGVESKLAEAARAGTPLPFCARHATMHERRRLNEQQRERNRLDRERERAEARKREKLADNLAQFLSEQTGVPWFRTEQGHGVAVLLEDAQKLYQAGAVFAVPHRPAPEQKNATPARSRANIPALVAYDHNTAPATLT